LIIEIEIIMIIVLIGINIEEIIEVKSAEGMKIIMSPIHLETLEAARLIGIERIIKILIINKVRII